MEKAGRALASARVLASAGDREGACNRAYYAMFNAVRCALAMPGAPPEAVRAKTHSGLRAAFNLHLIKSEVLPLDMGNDLRRAEHLRLVADYIGDPISSDDVETLLAMAIEFVRRVGARFDLPVDTP